MSLIAVKPQLKIDWATHEAAKYACENWHYSRCLPIGKLVKVGAWENGKFIGVVLFGRGASPNLGKKFNLGQDQCVELVRVALTKHQVAVSKIVAIAIKFLKKSNPKLRLIVSFADPDKGHHGGIYQAGNWIFCGDSGSTTELFIRGRWMHMRGGFKDMTKDTPQRIMVGKHRYIIALDDEMRSAIITLSKPYPKRVKDQDSEHPSELGGETPTHTLQTKVVTDDPR